MPVWNSLHDALSGNIARSPWAVLDDELLTEPLRQPLTDQPCDDVAGAASGKADDNAHRPCRIGLRLRNPRDRRQRGSARGQMQKLSTVGKFHGVASRKSLFANRDVMECPRARRLSRFDASKFNHLAPFLSFVRDEFAKFDGCHRCGYSAAVGKPHLDLGISKACINLAVESINNVRGSTLGSTKARPTDHHIAGQRFRHRWNFW